MRQSSGSQIFRTNTGIQSGPEAFHKSKFIITFLTILRVTEILESSRLEFSEKFLAKILLYQMRKTTSVRC